MEVKEVTSREKCYEGFTLAEKQLGNGDFGIAFAILPSKKNKKIIDELNASTSYVLKQILIEETTPKPKKDFISEVKIGIALGEMKAAPRIYGSWFCRDTSTGILYGYYVMDRLSGVWKDTYGHHLATSKEHQTQLIDAIDQSVRSGYLHQDCHVGNIGFVSDKVKLFDFGLTLEIPPSCSECSSRPDVIALLVASQLFIVIEQYDRDEMFSDGNLIHARIVEMIGSMETVPTKKKITFEQQNAKITECLERVNTSFGSCCDMIKTNIFMTYLYQVIDSYSCFPEYSTDLYSEATENFFPGVIYDLIYEIRRGNVNFTTLADTFLGKKGTAAKGTAKGTAKATAKGTAKSTAKATARAEALGEETDEDAEESPDETMAAKATVAKATVAKATSSKGKKPKKVKMSEPVEEEEEAVAEEEGRRYTFRSRDRALKKSASAKRSASRGGRKRKNRTRKIRR